MLKGDTDESAIRAATIFSDARVRQFYDPAREVGQAIAQTIGWPGRIAWDIYLFYAPNAMWGDLPPAPITYLHQLSASWATPERRRRGPILVEALRDTMQQLIAGEAAFREI